MSVEALIAWPYKAGGRSRRGSPKAGATVVGFVSTDLSPPATQVHLNNWEISFSEPLVKICCKFCKGTSCSEKLMWLVVLVILQYSAPLRRLFLLGGYCPSYFFWRYTLILTSMYF